ncbi:aminotransferase class V-fold PLP-dependent enzyme [Nocardia zapadnayensis]|uniref:aminotransferase class V-fold PLP-dependent enzyme n=1 Tax=Nocardia rhamnosiphila TaxID=426716 RepID=UPI0022485236|nr:aminotransferase class V-fold PLP-dependent enzyme [Nocardia zapadnayensis]MCX0271682.1 aminotransferase class V-fold PLP-dependent enzyme [Nocardia zapadnayensis]
MKKSAYTDFALEPGLVQLNHASYGLTSRHVMNMAESERYRIESDPTLHLGSELTDGLRSRTSRTAEMLGLEVSRTTFCTNATSGAAAVIGSLPLAAGDTVVVLDAEYSSIIRAWATACERVSAHLLEVPVPLPLQSSDQLLTVLNSAVPGSVTYMQLSVISSSAALRLPIEDIARWVRDRGGRLILDVAHAPGHIPVAPDAWGAAAMFGTLHKWLPTLRPVGLLWLTDDLVDRVRPAEVSLTWDSADLVERFSWPGTFDPVPRLTATSAIDQWEQWQDAALLAECERLADLGCELLTEIGAQPTASTELSAPRMRAFVLRGVTVVEIKAVLRKADIRAWVGPGPQGRCLLRFATHIYNDQHDLEALAGRIKEALPR